MSKEKKSKAKSTAKPKVDQTYASDESGVYERYGLSTHSRVYADYIEQNKSKLRKIKVWDKWHIIYLLCKIRKVKEAGLVCFFWHGGHP